MDIYDRVTNLLTERGISRRALAKKAGIAPATLNSAFARRTVNISLDFVRRIAEALDVSVDDILLSDEEKASRAATAKAFADTISSFYRATVEIAKRFPYHKGLSDEAMQMAPGQIHPLLAEYCEWLGKHGITHEDIGILVNWMREDAFKYLLNKSKEEIGHSSI